MELCLDKRKDGLYVIIRDFNGKNVRAWIRNMTNGKICFINFPTVNIPDYHNGDEFSILIPNDEKKLEYYTIDELVVGWKIINYH